MRHRAPPQWETRAWLARLASWCRRRRRAPSGGHLPARIHSANHSFRLILTSRLAILFQQIFSAGGRSGGCPPPGLSQPGGTVGRSSNASNPLPDRHLRGDGSAEEDDYK